MTSIRSAYLTRGRPAPGETRDGAAGWPLPRRRSQHGPASETALHQAFLAATFLAGLLRAADLVAGLAAALAGAAFAAAGFAAGLLPRLVSVRTGVTTLS